MNKIGKEKFYQELDNFLVTKLRPIPEHRSECNYVRFEDNFPQLTNHEICQQMFWNAFKGYSKMYIQIGCLRDDNSLFNDSEKIMYEKGAEAGDDEKVIILQCSLLTLQMLDYDIMMFGAMSEGGDEEYRNTAQKHYRPYLFSYVAEIDKSNYEKLKELQNKIVGSQTYSSSDEYVENYKNGQLQYQWLPCTFNSDINENSIKLDGYVVQSASRIEKIKANLTIIEDENTPKKVRNRIFENYKLDKSSCKDDKTFIEEIEKKLGNTPLSTIDAYKIGNGNCVFAQSNDTRFFYDIGFNYKHRPKKISHGSSYNYSSSMQKIVVNDPSFVILSHWDMDHIAGSYVARKNIFEKNWFAPDCYDAGTNALRLAKYLQMKGNLYLANRPPRKSNAHGRLIGKIAIQKLAIYKLYMGKKTTCDSSHSNCEGIVIEYYDKIKNIRVLMMGDVNYDSFNKARSTEPSFADTQIDYLIVPHHGSEHTNYQQITDPNKPVKMGSKAIICCTDDPNINRPNSGHRMKLEKRFGKNVITTEEAKNKAVSITISL
ncbi:hypothetical protein [Acetobacterium carbinolicum]|uniref:hypothetical protein n=1 Tax=Acetobacterium carbinolicum TaxID=52690 RepID=UPI0039C9C8D6